MSQISLNLGDTFSMAKTIGESDVYLFAGITGDFHPNHCNEEYMSKTPFKHRIAHGMLTMSFAASCSTQAAQQGGLGAVSYGYDRVRFIKPVFIGDTLHVRYIISDKDIVNARTVADIEIMNQNGDVCAVAKHILKFM